MVGDMGTVISNWKMQVMIFDVEGKPVILVGDPSLVRAQLSLKAMIRTLQKEGGGSLMECNQLEHNDSAVGTVVPEFLQAVMQEHHSVFQQPPRLPPQRGHDHAITLQEGSNPVGVRPYRYP